MIDYLALIDKYYAGQPELRHILVTHSRQVADRALAIIDAIRNGRRMDSWTAGL